MVVGRTDHLYSGGCIPIGPSAGQGAANGTPRRNRKGERKGVNVRNATGGVEPGGAGLWELEGKSRALPRRHLPRDSTAGCVIPLLLQSGSQWLMIPLFRAFRSDFQS